MREKHTSPCMFLALLTLCFSFPIKSIRMKIGTIAQNGFDESDSGGRRWICYLFPPKDREAF